MQARTVFDDARISQVVAEGLRRFMQVYIKIKEIKNMRTVRPRNLPCKLTGSSTAPLQWRVGLLWVPPVPRSRPPSLCSPSIEELLADSQYFLKHTEVWAMYFVTVYLYSIQFTTASEQISAHLRICLQRGGMKWEQEDKMSRWILILIFDQVTYWWGNKSQFLFGKWFGQLH